MPISRFVRGHAKTCILIGLLTLFAGTAYAQDAPRRTVVLDVKGGDSDALRDAIGEVENVEVKNQKWFLRQIRQREVRAHKIMKRPKDLRFVMSGSDIQYVVAVIPEDGAYEAAIYDSSGEPVRRFSLEGGEFGVERAGEVRAEFEQLLGIGFEMGDDVAEETFVEETPADEPGEPVETAAASSGPDDGDVPWLVVEPTARMFKRDLSRVGEGGAALTFRSAFYPGVSVDAELMPSNAAVGEVGLGGYLSADIGFDSLSADEESIPILHLEAAGGVGLRLPTAADLRLRIGARHARFTLDSNDFLPSVTQTLLVAGLLARHRLGAATIDSSLSVIPYGLHGADRRLFGESSRVLGFAGGLALRFGLSDSLDATIGYRFRALQSRFAGDGTLEFRDTVGFELVQGPRLGITLHY